MDSIKVREYENSDKEGVIKMIEELQDVEHSLEENRLPGKGIGDRYFTWLLKTCANQAGKILILEVSWEIAGFSAVYVVEDDDMINTYKKYAFLSDLIVKEKYRGRGFSSDLIDAVKKHVKSLGIKHLQVSTLYNNKTMQEVALKNGFRGYEITYIQEVV
jgi:GNAT superfamily N-acetyltransferase